MIKIKVIYLTFSKKMLNFESLSYMSIIKNLLHNYFKTSSIKKKSTPNCFSVLFT